MQLKVLNGGDELRHFICDRMLVVRKGKPSLPLLGNCLFVKGIQIGMSNYPVHRDHMGIRIKMCNCRERGSSIGCKSISVPSILGCDGRNCYSYNLPAVHNPFHWMTSKMAPFVKVLQSMMGPWFKRNALIRRGCYDTLFVVLRCNIGSGCINFWFCFQIF